MDKAGFTRVSHAVWEAMAPGWDDRHAYFEGSARPVTDRMLETLDPAPGDVVLDLELELDDVECRVLDAERLDMPDRSVDGVLCRWGLMLMADPASALRETRRVLRPGGRVACAVFAGPEQNPWAALPAQVLRERGHMRGVMR